MEETLEKVDLRALIKYAGIILSILSFVFAGVTWMEDRYVNETEYARHLSAQKEKLTTLENKVVVLIDSIEQDRDRDYNQILKEIKDSKIFSLVVQRDILLSRGRANLSPSEQAKLEVLNTKLHEMGVN